jgi:vacuolar-type H+-ATPase subunit E/Vma4
LAVRADESAADGLRLVSADGRIAADLSYRVVAEDFWRRRRFDVAKRLLAEALEISPPRR